MTSLTLRAEHLWQRRHTPEAKLLFRYEMVSVISTIVGFGVLVLVFGVLRLWGEIMSTVVANVVATFPAYVLNRRWVWGKSGRSHLMKEIVPFWGMQGLGIAVSIGGAAVARHIGIEYQLSHRMQTALVLFANLASSGVFYVLKYMVFNRLFRVHTLRELDDLVEHSPQSESIGLAETARQLSLVLEEFDRRSASWASGAVRGQQGPQAVPSILVGGQIGVEKRVPPSPPGRALGARAATQRGVSDGGLGGVWAPDGCSVRLCCRRCVTDVARAIGSEPRQSGPATARPDHPPNWAVGQPVTIRFLPPPMSS